MVDISDVCYHIQITQRPVEDLVAIYFVLWKEKDKNIHFSVTLSREVETLHCYNAVISTQNMNMAQSAFFGVT